jgi:hypothetical protein
MLTNNSRRMNAIEDMEFIHNYYEKLALEEIIKQSRRAREGDREFLADVACVSLNRLPPRYIRHDVDMTFFMSPQETAEIEQKVVQSVADAIDYVESRERNENTRFPAMEILLSADDINSSEQKERSGDKKSREGDRESESKKMKKNKK